MLFIENCELSWFSLSEAVKRKEREKALFSFRLLSHSIKNENFKTQLLADLYFFLDEKETAFFFYKEVFKNYIESKDYFGIYSILNRIDNLEETKRNYFVSEIKILNLDKTKNFLIKSIDFSNF